MDFIRKHWSRLSIALLFLLGGILGIVAIVNSGMMKDMSDATTGFYNIVLLLSILLYFFGMTCLMILKACTSKKVVSIAYMVMGSVIAVLNIVLLCVCVNDARISLMGSEAVNVFLRFIVPTLVFGFYPLLKGVTRFIEAELVPVPAPVKPAAQPVEAKEAPVAPKAAAPKTTAAKKTTKAAK